MKRIALVILSSLALASEGHAESVKEMPAVNRQRYPDSVGYLYEGALATVVWMQNHLPFVRLDQLERRLSRGMQHGLSGEIVDETLQRVQPVSSAQPPLRDLARRAAQSVRLLAQYSFVARDYAASLGTALGQYNRDPARRRAIRDAAARIDAGLRAVGQPGTGGPLPDLPPPPEESVVVPGRYFAQAVVDGKREHLRRRVRALQQALSASHTGAYASAFADVFYAQLDPNLREEAQAALAVGHEAGILKGQAFDRAVSQIVLPSADPGSAMSMDQLRLVNQINLAANDLLRSRAPLIAALLLVAEDLRYREEDSGLSYAQIWAHAGDLTWLVSEYVRVKGGGMTQADALALINDLVANYDAP